VTDEPFARSPLEERSGDLETIGAHLLPLLTQIDFRVDPANAGRSPYPLPLEPNTSFEDDGVEVLWLGPDEWLIVGPSGSAARITSALETPFSDVHRSIVDASANRVAFELASGDRLDLLSHICSLDLEPPAWAPGRCAQTLVGRAQVLLQERRNGTRLFIRPSFAGYMVDLLLQVRSVRDDLGA